MAEFQRDGLVAATDGSFDPHRRKAAGSWVLATRDGRKTISGASPVDGDAETLDSYRAELGALRSLVYYIRFLRRTRPALTKDIVLTVGLTIYRLCDMGLARIQLRPYQIGFRMSGI